MYRGLIAAILLGTVAGQAQTTRTNCQTMPIGSMIRTHCTSNTYDPWPAIQENRRIWEKFSADMNDVAMKVQERLLINKVQKLEEELLQKQKEKSEDLSVIAPKLTALVQAQCKEGYLGTEIFAGKDPNTSNPEYARWRDGCRKLGYWKGSAEENEGARQKT